MNRSLRLVKSYTASSQFTHAQKTYSGLQLFADPGSPAMSVSDDELLQVSNSNEFAPNGLHQIVTFPRIAIDGKTFANITHSVSPPTSCSCRTCTFTNRLVSRTVPVRRFNHSLKAGDAAARVRETEREQLFKCSFPLLEILQCVRSAFKRRSFLLTLSESKSRPAVTQPTSHGQRLLLEPQYLVGASMA